MSYRDSSRPTLPAPMVIDYSDDEDNRMVDPLVFTMVATIDYGPGRMSPHRGADIERMFRVHARPASATKMLGHKTACWAFGMKPLRIPRTSAAGSRGYTHLCECGLFWAEEER